MAKAELADSGGIAVQTAASVNIMGDAFILPDDPEFGGEYSVSLKFGSMTRTVTFKLDYNGDYSTCTGWSVSDINWH